MKYFVSYIFVLLFIGCTANKKEIYQKESETLIKQALLDFGDEGYEDHILSHEANKTLLELLEEDNPEAEYKSILRNALQIEKDNVFNNCIELSRSFKFSKKILGNRSVIKNADLINIIKKNGSTKGREIIFKLYPKGWLLVKPPVFNETFNIAIVSVGSTNGGFLVLYKYKNNKWVFDKRLMGWIS